MSFLLWLTLLQTSLAVNVAGPNGTVVTQILSATSSNPEVKVVEDRDLGKILVYPPQPKEFTVKIIARIMYPDDQYLEKISTVMVGGAGVTIESNETRNSLILATLKVAPGASGGRFSITYENEDNPNHKGCNVRLLSVEVTVTKEGEATAPEDGLVVKKSDTVRYRLLKGVPDNPALLEDKIQWHWRILKWDGTYEDWKPFQDGKGHTFGVSPKDSGIYEIKATLDGQDFFFKRKKDDPHSAKKKDENDCFGVVDEQWQIDVRHEAKRNLGSKAYAQGVRNSNVPAGPPGGYKCNLFVGHKASDGGATVPKINGRNPFSKYFPTANQWAGTPEPDGSPAKNIPNWTLLGVQTYPQPGFVVARGKPGGTGHTGIVGYDGAWISAGTTEVNRKADVRTYKPSRFSKYTP